MAHSVQRLNGHKFQESGAERSGFIHDQVVKTTEQDRMASFCNTLRGYEEFLLNADGIIISSNLEAVNITGYEEWEVIGKHFSLFYPADEINSGRPAEDLRNAVFNGKIFYTGSRIKKKGIPFWAKIRISTLRDDRGQTTGFRMIIKDSTHNALYKYRVKRVRDEYMSLFNNSFIGIFKFSLKDSAIILLNEKACELLSLKDGEGVRFSEMFSSQAHFAGFMHSLETQAGSTCETEIERNGKWISVNCRSFADQGFAEGILIDITEKKKQVEELERLNQEIDRFIYHSSHDMRAPLTTVMGLTNLIALEHPQGRIMEYNRMIQAQVEHLDNLLKSLVNITFNKSEPVYETIDFRKEVEVILRELRHSFDRVKVETIFEGNSFFFSDPARIHIILKNLISNAFRFHNPHATVPLVRIRLQTFIHETVIHVEDNGIGIDERALGNVFTMFYKAERGSTGLGLYIVKSMVDKLGGTIAVTSRRSEGSVFTVRIPCIHGHRLV